MPLAEFTNKNWNRNNPISRGLTELYTQKRESPLLRKAILGGAKK